MGLFGKKSFFPYVGEIGNDVTKEIRGTVARAQGILGLSDGTGGRETAVAINETVDRILENGGMPEGFADLEDAAVCLGCCSDMRFAWGSSGNGRRWGKRRERGWNQRQYRAAALQYAGEYRPEA